MLQTCGSDGAGKVPAQTLPFDLLLLTLRGSDRPLTQAVLTDLILNFEWEKVGGDEGDRTPDLMNAIHALSQLSYVPRNWNFKSQISNLRTADI